MSVTVHRISRQAYMDLPVYTGVSCDSPYVVVECWSEFGHMPDAYHLVFRAFDDLESAKSEANFWDGRVCVKTATECEIWQIVDDPVETALAESYTARDCDFQRMRFSALRSFCRIDNPRTFQTALDDCREGIIEVPITFITPKHDKDSHASKHVMVRW